MCLTCYKIYHLNEPDSERVLSRIILTFFVWQMNTTNYFQSVDVILAIVPQKRHDSQVIFLYFWRIFPNDMQAYSLGYEKGLMFTSCDFFQTGNHILWIKFVFMCKNLK